VRGVAGAGAAEIAALPGFGPALAARIVGALGAGAGAGEADAGPGGG
jgi:hypothetical protein